MESNLTVPTYGPGDCPDTLAWSTKEQFCLLECIFPLYSDNELESLFIVDRVFGCIGFLLCYFYCFTALFRPSMQRFPNSNALYIIFSFMVLYVSVLLPFILGSRYVFCDDDVTPGSDNWACIISGRSTIIDKIILTKWQAFAYTMGLTLLILGSYYFISLSQRVSS